MYTVIDCQIPEEQMEKWLHTYIPAESPYFIADEEIVDRLLRAGVTVYTKADFRANMPAYFLAYVADFGYWMIPGDFQIVVMSERQLDALDADLRTRVLEQQIQLERGHIYEEDWFQRVGIQVEEKTPFFLTSEKWTKMSPELQKKWLLQHLADAQEHQTPGLPLPPLDHLPAGTRDLITRYVGRIADTTGANCFAAALAAAIGNMHGDAVINRWLHGEPLFRSLQAIGYQKAGVLGQDAAVQPQDVLVWRSADGVPIHAAYAITTELAFQKFGQTWYQAWRIVRIADVYDYADVVAQGGCIELHRR